MEPQTHLLWDILWHGPSKYSMQFHVNDEVFQFRWLGAWPCEITWECVLDSWCGFGQFFIFMCRRVLQCILEVDALLLSFWHSIPPFWSPHTLHLSDHKVPWVLPGFAMLRAGNSLKTQSWRNCAIYLMHSLILQVHYSSRFDVQYLENNCSTS